MIIGLGGTTAFHFYIIADLTDGPVKRLSGRFEPTPDGKGFFGYTQNPDTYAEVIPYGKLLLDAQARNAIFFDKLGLGAEAAILGIAKGLLGKTLLHHCDRHSARKHGKRANAPTFRGPEAADFVSSFKKSTSIFAAPTSNADA